MVRHPFGQAKGNMESIIKGLGEKFDESFISEAQLVDIVGPVNKEPTPDHYSKHREVDPMKPSNSEWMLFHYFLHNRYLMVEV